MLEMAPYYKLVTAATPSLLPLDTGLLKEMETANEEDLKKLDERLEEARKTEGETEISDALKARANYLTQIGHKARPFCLISSSFRSCKLCIC
jgi:26S proteasome regulatory subunit N7